MRPNWPPSKPKRLWFIYGSVPITPVILQIGDKNGACPLVKQEPMIPELKRMKIWFKLSKYLYPKKSLVKGQL